MRISIRNTVGSLACFLAFALPAFAQDAARPAASPAEPVEARPVEAQPVEARPVEARPVEARPVEATATPVAGNAIGKPAPLPKLQPISVLIELSGGMGLKGTLANMDQWSMKTSFGTTSLPLSALMGVKFAGEGNASTTVVLHNGDSITGALELDLVNLETEWGSAEVRGTHINSILFIPGLKWVSENGLGGIRWKLAADEPKPPAKPAVAPQPVAVPVAQAPKVPRPVQPQFQPQPQPTVSRTVPFYGP